MVSNDSKESTSSAPPPEPPPLAELDGLLAMTGTDLDADEQVIV